MSNPSASLYVGDLHRDVNEPMLHDVFRVIGQIQSIRLCRDAFTRVSLGYAYVNFFNVEDAERALEALNYTTIKNRPVRIMWCHRDPAIRRSGVGNVFIKNLHPEIDNKALYDTFSLFGNILSCKVATDEQNKSRGFGFVHFETQEAADKAIENVNGKELLGQIVFVGMWKSRRERMKQNQENFTNLYVKNINPDWKEEDLQRYFSRFGNITSVAIKRAETGESKGFGFVNFEEPNAAKAARDATNNTEVEGRVLYVARHQSKSEREAQKRIEYQQQNKQHQGVNLYVKNLDDDIDTDRLYQEFSQFGTITSHTIMRDVDGTSKGFGFVCFSTPEEATRAVTEMNNRMIGTKPLYVAIAQKKELRREHLAAQRNARNTMSQMMAGGMHPQNMPAGPPSMYPPGVFYPQGPMAPQQYPYPPPAAMMRPRWVGQAPAGADGFQQPHPAFMAGPAGQLGGPQQVQQGAGAGGRGGRGGGARRGGAGGQGGQPRGNRGGQSGFKLNPQARNRDQPQPQGVPQGMAQPGYPVPMMPSQEQDLPAILASSTAEERRLILGERLYPLVETACADKSEYAPKVTGMLLQIEPSEVLVLLESRDDLVAKVQEALHLIESAQSSVPVGETPGATVEAQ